MDDLISRQAALSVLSTDLDKIPMVNNSANDMIRRDERIMCINTIRALPSAEPEIIRCKDCKYRDDDGFCTGRGYPNVLVPDDGFCDKGERSEG